MKWTVAFVCLASWMCSGCMLFGGLRVEEVATSADRPSNVAVYLTVTRKGQPVPALTAQSFTISEDGQVVSADQTKQTLLPRNVAAVHRALLLVDMSGQIAEGDARERIARAAAWFVSRVKKSQPVSVFAFDGASTIRSVGEFEEGPDDVAEIPGLKAFEQTDPSSNLHSAVVEAAAQLDARLMSAQKPVRVGSLVVFARGPDLAGRVTEAKMLEVLRDSGHLVFAIGTKESGFRASRLGEHGAFEATDPSKLAETFDDAGTHVARTVGDYYLLSYCSPARAGKKRLRIEVTTTDEKGSEARGSLSTEFDATGFGSGCDPNQTPRFVVRSEPEERSEQREESGSDAPKVRGRTAPSPRPAPAPAPEPAPPPAPAEEGDDIVPPPAKPGYAQ